MNRLLISCITLVCISCSGSVQQVEFVGAVPQSRAARSRVVVYLKPEQEAPSWCWSPPIGLADYQKARAWYLGTQFVRALLQELEGIQAKVLLGQTFGAIDTPERNGAPLFVVYPFAIRAVTVPGVELVQSFASVADDVFDRNHNVYVLSLLPTGVVEGLVNEEHAFGIRIDYRIRLLHSDPDMRSRFGVSGNVCILPRGNDSIIVYDRVRTVS